MPFLGALSSPQKVFDYSGMQPLITLLGIKSAEGLLLPLTAGFVLLSVVASSMRLLMSWVNNRLSYAVGADTSTCMYYKTLYQPYSVHVSRNSSEIISGIVKKTDTVIAVLLALLNLLGSGLILFAILMTLLWLQPVIALLVFGGFGLIYALIVYFTRRRVKAYGQQISSQSSQVIKALQEGLGGIRDVLIDGNQDTYIRRFLNANLPLRRAYSEIAFISIGPRYLMEAIGMSAIAIAAYLLSSANGGLIAALPALGAVALGAQRMLPLLQQIYHAWTTILGGMPSFRDAMNLIEQALPAYLNGEKVERINFAKKIRLDSLSFRHSPLDDWILSNVNFEIVRGSRIGLIGTTGSGKSTLSDIIMGLLQPTEGALMVDALQITDKNANAWHKHIAHVPQSIFLADATIAENIAFGENYGAIDQQRLEMVAEQAQIADFIKTLPSGYGTVIGERGVRLSGGQRQRIGIARALYKNADVIVLDEATSALDTFTEDAVMKTVESLSKELTILIVAHRITTLKICDRIIELANGGIHQIYTYDDLLAKQVSK